MSFGIEVFDAGGNKTLGMEDFTYSLIYQQIIPAPGSNTLDITVPGFSNENCVVVFTPTVPETGDQPIDDVAAGFVPVYSSPSAGVVRVHRRTLAWWYDGSNNRYVDYYTMSAESRMEVYQVFGG
jgi:hypothetical protein